MRYVRGSIAISELADLPLLLEVRNARYISQLQLAGLLGYDATDLARKRLAWRVDRLASASYLQMFEQRIQSQKVFSIARRGLQYLEARGHQLISMTSTMEKYLDPSQLMHCLELNSIRLTFQRTGVLLSWKGDVEVSSENMETGGEYAKDYDAVASFRSADKILRFGIEYERTTKAHARYQGLRQLLSQETALDGILYFVRGPERLFAIANELEGAHPHLLFCAAENFALRGMNTAFLQHLAHPALSLIETLGLESVRSHSPQGQLPFQAHH